VIALGVPLVLEALYPRRFLLLPWFQILALTALPFFPFGMKLTSPGGLLFGGRFLRSWSPLPFRARGSPGPSVLFLANAALDLPSVGFVYSESFWRDEAFGLGLLGASRRSST
jgi:hypothetical protein